MSTPFKSYAQNFEDVMLYRALGNVWPGFYIDVGAQDPDIDSVSKAFFERGWRGIHIEPVPEYAERLREARPGDKIIEAAVSNVVGTTALTVFPKTGLSTTDPLVAKNHIDRGIDHQPEPIIVSTVTLAELSLELELAEATVHWLKIDVEGHERSVLEGWDTKRLRPWIIVVEATIPNEQVTNHEEWEPILSEAGYQCVYGDGLNRFYIEPQREDLAQALSCPPNPFDNIHLGKYSALCNGVLAEAEQDLTEVKQKLMQSEQTLTETDQKYTETEQRLAESAHKLAETEQRLAETDQRLAETEQRLAESEQKLAETDQRLVESDQRLAETDHRLAESVHKLAERDQRLAESEQNLAEAERKHKVTEKKRKESEQKRKESEQKRKESEKKLAESEADIETLKRQSDALTSELQLMGRDLSSVRTACDALQHDSEHWRAAYNGMLQSRSWRLTAPVRRVLDLFGYSPRNKQSQSLAELDTELEAPLNEAAPPTEAALSPEGEKWAMRLRQASKGDDS